MIDILAVFRFLCVIVVAHVVNVFGCWVIHYVQHQRVLGVDLYRIHLEGHHAQDRHLSTPGLRLMWYAVSQALWAVLILMFWALYYFVFTEWVALTFMAESVVLSAGIYYLHREYDNPDSRLGRFSWFRRARVRHEIHHGHQGDFSRSFNYAIGGPLVGALPDRVFATLQDVPEARPAASGIQPLDSPASVVAACGPGPAAHPTDDDGRGSPGFGDGDGSMS